MSRPLVIAGAYAQLYLRAIARPMEELLAGTGLTADDLGRQNYLPFQPMARMMRNADAGGAEPGWAARIGDRLNLNTHGPLGFAALSAPNLGAALTAMATLHPVRINTLDAEVRTEGTRTLLVLQDLTDDPLYARYTLEPVLRIAETLIETIVGHSLGAQVEIAFAHAAPAYAPVLTSIYSARCRFDAVETSISMPASWLHIPSPLYDEDSFQTNCARCREIMATLVDPGDTAQQVRNALARHFDTALVNSAPGASPPGLERIAGQLHITPRTLIRRLKRQGTSYRTLLDGARLECACRLLQQAQLSVADVGYRLGYSDPANFGRAFRKLTGVTPAAWRRGTRPA
ncbi:MAG: AraC family transcriptional regulator ligand-binding domain-containing protein [Halioglobus sp.]|nr:AraC family transcriptional regulator ligand-binding domain-containing protein [Halioglobus sp.]